MSVIRLPIRGEPASAPLLCLVDLQFEYVAEGRPLAIAEREPWLSNCRRLLAFAREHRMPLAHFRQLRRDGLFNPASAYADWIEEFRPRPFEMVFERSKPSCYASDSFLEFMDNMDRPLVILAGLTGEGACLATAIDAFHKNHECIFVADASGSRPLSRLSEVEGHEFLSDVIGLYAELITTSGLVMKYSHKIPGSRRVSLREERL
jgi:nicotinamidase-related amidase